MQVAPFSRLIARCYHSQMDAPTDPTPARTIDLNADAGESFGRWRVVDERALFPYLSSVNLACGFHAGDPQGLVESIALAVENGVAIGAHPGFPDKVGFGRRDMSVSTAELEADVVYQLGAVAALARAAARELHHAKAHGALYQQMTVNERVADAFTRAVLAFRADLPVVVLGGPGGELMRSAVERAGALAVAEAFPDRAYLSSGLLAPRYMDGALITDVQQIAERAVAFATEDAVPALDGGTVKVHAETLCLHGDGPSAVEAARAVRASLEYAGVTVRAHS